MEVEDLCRRGNTFQAKFTVTDPCTIVSTETREYIISGTAIVQIKVKAHRHKYLQTDYIYNIFIFIKFVKLRQDDDLTYSIKFSSNEFGIVNKSFITDDGTWRLIHDYTKEQCSFDVTVQMDIVPSASSFATLHEDIELTDIELRGEDGSVHMHRAVLAAASPVLRRMLGGTWREAAEGQVDVPGTRKPTLQHFKDYVYLHTLPEVGLEQLLLLASYYMMTDLEQICVFKLVGSLTAANACDLLEFAVKHKVTRLMLAILWSVHSEAVKVEEIQDNFFRSK